MKKLACLALVLCFLLVPFSVMAGETPLTLQWEQEMTPNFYGWKMWVSETAGGPYTQFGEDLVYDGSPAPTYSSSSILTSPEDQVTTYYFVVDAWGLNGRNSDYSNEVSHEVDYTRPNVPVQLTIPKEPAAP